MKDIKFFGLLSVAALAMSVSSCTNDNEPQVSDNNTENNSGVEGFTIQANIGDIQQTRATVKPEDGKSFTWQPDDKFDLYQNTAMATANAFAIDNNSITDNGKSANFSCADFTPATVDSYYAFYPQGFTVAENTLTYNIPDAAYSQSENNNTDHLKAGMIMVATGNSDDLSNGISFSHKTALFRFGVTNLTGDVVTVKSVKLSSTSTKCFARSYSYIVGGSETVESKNSELNLSFGAGVSVDKNSSLKAYAVAIPADAISAGETFTLEVTYNNDNQTKSNSFIINESFEVGHVYSFNIDIESDVLQVDKIYLAGTAIEGIENVEVTQTLENEKIYAYYDNLKAGTLYLPIELGGERNKAIIPNVGGNHDINDGQKQNFSQTNISNVENNYWTIPSEGKYRIVVNIETKEITIYSEEKDMPLREYSWNNTVEGINPYKAPVEALWMWGDFDAAAEKSVPSDKYKMTPSNASPYIFTYSGELNNGTVKFLVSNILNNVYAFGATNIKNQHLEAELNMEYVMVPGQGDNRYSRYKIPEGTNFIVVDITDDKNPTVVFSKR